MVGMAVRVLFPVPMITMCVLVGRRIAPRPGERGRMAFVSLTRGPRVLRTPSRFASVFGWTLAHWLVNALAFWIAFQAVRIDAPYSAALFLHGLIPIGVAAPQAPRLLGVFEFFGIARLCPL